MPVRRVIRIDKDKCDGCGLCVSACHEGAIQLVDGKAELVSDSYCDGLGDCIGECPRGAITFEEREALPYDEEAVKARKAEAGGAKAGTLPCGCPGTMARSLGGHEGPSKAPKPNGPSLLRNWPVQLRLVPANAPYLKGAKVLLASDCSAVATRGFQERLLEDRVCLMACPKLDDTSTYVDKLAEIIRGGVQDVRVAIMEVPCCSGLARIAREAAEAAKRDLTMEIVTLSVEGEVLSSKTLEYRFGA
ncbi:MAG: 4Fe-4S binding protein [Thermanaerothrix sp.]|nr:4Fe-4S binding protein [Thermanaerothrix sp.]